MKLRNKKTGEIGEPRVSYQEIYVDTAEHNTYCYKTIAGLSEDWEDYKPKEPLIKDEKIRKAVRAWAEAVSNSDALIEFDESAGSLWCNRSRIQFDNAELKGLENWQEYTIAELCGEEEE